MRLKHLLILTTIFLSLHCYANSAEDAFIRANTAYNNQQYKEAAIIYDSLLKIAPSAELYYNLGNAYFKQNNLSQSILAYERALRIRPHYEDAQNNLQFAQSKIEDNIEDNQPFFLSKWMTSLRNTLSKGTWTLLSIIFFSLMLAGLLGFFFFRSVTGRVIGFNTAWITLLLCIFSFSFALSLHKQSTQQAEAIITLEQVHAKSSPDKAGKSIFLLHEGTKVTIKSTVPNWAEIHVGNHVGWIPLSALERI